MTMSDPRLCARPWHVDAWFNASTPPTLDALRGRVVVVLAFQMLCPGCVSHALPLATRVHRLFPHERVAMIGLHTVFEHHDAMTPTALAAFLHEYRVTFPVGIDRAGGTGPVPATMRAYSMRGTPTWLVFDRGGRLRSQWFGDVDPLRLGSEIGTWLERAQTPGRDAGDTTPDPAAADSAGCDAGACRPGDDRG